RRRRRYHPEGFLAPRQRADYRGAAGQPARPRAGLAELQAELLLADAEHVAGLQLHRLLWAHAEEHARAAFGDVRQQGRSILAEADLGVPRGEQGIGREVQVAAGPPD